MTKKDVIAAWLVCSLILVSFFIGTVLAANLAIASCLVDVGQEGKANSVLIHNWVGP